MGAHAGRDRRRRRRCPHPGRRALVDRDLRVRTPWGRRRRRRPGGGRQRHRPVGEHGARRRGGSPGRAVRAVERHPRGAVLREAGGRPGLRLRAQGAGHLAATQRRHPEHVGRRPGRAHAPPPARVPRGARPGAMADGARRLPDHAVHRRSCGQPCVDDRRVADRQPVADHAGLRRRARPGSRRRRVTAAAPGRDGVGRRAGAARGGRAARHPAVGRRRDRASRPARRRRRRRGRRARPAARLHRHHRLDQRARAAEEDRRAAAAGQRAGHRQRVVPARQQPGVRRSQPPVVARHRRSRADLRHAAGRGGGDVARAQAAWCSRPG